MDVALVNYLQHYLASSWVLSHLTLTHLMQSHLTSFPQVVSSHLQPSSSHLISKSNLIHFISFYLILKQRLDSSWPILPRFGWYCICLSHTHLVFIPSHFKLPSNPHHPISSPWAVSSHYISSSLIFVHINSFQTRLGPFNLPYQTDSTLMISELKRTMSTFAESER